MDPHLRPLAVARGNQGIGVFFLQAKPTDAFFSVVYLLARVNNILVQIGHIFHLQA
tara:strand:- start:88 stop:255 length:168 start_codon:yes stop_codon:yes gene_type:complete